MSKKSQESPKGKAIRALRMAFDAAKAGDKAKALTYWYEAQTHGYYPSPRTNRQFDKLMPSSGTPDTH